jgi:predicted dehydrogenase
MIGIGIIGIEGFALNHLASIKDCVKEGLCLLVAAVVRTPEKYVVELRKLQTEWPDLQIFSTIEEMLDREGTWIDLISLPTDIPSHRLYAEICLNRGHHVLCEKPAAGTIEDVLAMKATQERTGKNLAIGFQHIFSPSIQRIKKLIIHKNLGELISLSGTSRCKQTSSYYNRNNWAGRIKDGNAFIFDSPMQNINSHLLQNMLYLSGPEKHRSTLPVTVYGENYRAQNIESADTQYIRCTTKEGVVISLAATHATEDMDESHMECLFEKGRITWSATKGETALYDKEDNLMETFNDCGVPLLTAAYKDTIRAIKEKKRPLCHIGNAYQHTVCLNYLYHTTEGIRDIPACEKYDNIPTDIPTPYYPNSLKHSKDYVNSTIRHIDDSMKKMFTLGGIGFYEVGLSWAQKGKTLDVSLD